MAASFHLVSERRSGSASEPAVRATPSFPYEDLNQIVNDWAAEATAAGTDVQGYSGSREGEMAALQNISEEVDFVNRVNLYASNVPQAGYPDVQSLGIEARELGHRVFYFGKPVCITDDGLIRPDITPADEASGYCLVPYKMPPPESGSRRKKKGAIPESGASYFGRLLAAIQKEDYFHTWRSIVRRPERVAEVLVIAREIGMKFPLAAYAERLLSHPSFVYMVNYAQEHHPWMSPWLVLEQYNMMHEA